MQVNYDEVMRALDYLDSVNQKNLKEIEWVRDDGTKIEVSADTLEEWRFIGMSNQAFVETFLNEIVNGKKPKISWECLHPNACFYGDPHGLPTYKCDDCGLVFVKE